ncbi:MAG: metallophosphoesterase family protein, partial [Lachnospiraceae bacterium]|nr:metallophosphoesterase family protein [Lachnospiraceae bacterium]
MKILIIPDVHLKPHIIDEAAQCMCYGNYDIAVFLGDFVDDWEQQRNIKAYNDTFDALDEFLRQYPDTLICYGNHDLSYVWEELETGYSAYAHDTVLTRLHEIYKNHGTSRWKIVHKIDDVL